jgi:hypothetical protein
MLGVLAVGLLPQLRNEQVGYLCHLVRVLHSTQDYLALVALLLQVRGRAGLLPSVACVTHVLWPVDAGCLGLELTAVRQSTVKCSDRVLLHKAS